MDFKDPIKQEKKCFSDIIDKISLPDSPVGIDAQYTHAIIITYLKQIKAQLEELKKILESAQS